MPFAGYQNFAACVRANHDKRDPKAYCASIMHQVEGKGEEFHTKETTKIDAYGETDHEKQEVRINPARGDVVNTVIHERLHVKSPDMPHDMVYQAAATIESNMSVRDMANMLKEVADDIDQGAVAPIKHTRATKVRESKIMGE